MRLLSAPSRALLPFVLVSLLAVPAVAQESVTAEPAPSATEVVAPEAAPAASEAAPSAMDAGVPAAMDPGPAAPAPEPAGDALPSVPASTLPHDLSPWGMFMAADAIVKAVMIGLAIASVLTWTIWLAKSLELAASISAAKAALRGVTQSRSLDDALRAVEGRGGAGALLVKAAEEEVQLSIGALEHADGDGLKERVSSRLARLVAAAGRRASRGTGVLATIGSTSPFVGLFGTVWGIMNAFIGISESQTTNLAVVAPGIAEALLATAIGLVAAIPAVVIYNVFSRSVTGYRQLLSDVAAGVERLVSRDLDWRKVPARGTLRGGAAQPATEQA